MKLDPFLIPLRKINWSYNELSVRLETTKFLEEYKQKNLLDFGLVNNFWFWQEKEKSTSGMT